MVRVVLRKPASNQRFQWISEVRPWASRSLKVGSPWCATRIPEIIVLMKNRLIQTALIVALLWVGLAACSGPPPQPSPDPKPVPEKKQEVKPAPEKPRVVRGPFGIEIFRNTEVVMACLEVEGIPYSEMGDEIGRVARLLEKQGIKPRGFSRTIYLDDPRDVDSSRYHYRVGFPVASTALPRKPLERCVMPSSLTARVLHKGDFDEAFQVRFYEEIPAALKKMGYTQTGPVCEIYRFPVVEEDPTRWITEIWYPVAKKK